MNLEQLTKTQMILLAVLLSFVTSIATGIVTVTLVDQAPTDVTRTINRVVEKTVERVVPGETKIVERVKEISNPTQSDLAVSAIDKKRNILVRIQTDDNMILSRGFFVGVGGQALLIASAGAKEGDKFSLVWIGDKNSSSTPIATAVEKIHSDTGVMLVSPTSKTSLKYPFVSLNQSIVPGIGQQVISIGQDEGRGVMVDFSNITALIDANNKEGERRFIISGGKGGAFFGGPVLDLQGRILGFHIGFSSETKDSTVVPLSTLDKLFGSLIAVEKTDASQTASVNKSAN